MGASESVCPSLGRSTQARAEQYTACQGCGQWDALQPAVNPSILSVPHSMCIPGIHATALYASPEFWVSPLGWRYKKPPPIFRTGRHFLQTPNGTRLIGDSYSTAKSFGLRVRAETRQTYPPIHNTRSGIRCKKLDLACGLRYLRSMRTHGLTCRSIEKTRLLRLPIPNNLARLESTCNST